MTTIGKGFKVVDDKIVRKAPRKSVSQQIRERKSKKQKPVSRSKAASFNAIGKA